MRKLYPIFLTIAVLSIVIDTPAQTSPYEENDDLYYSPRKEAKIELQRTMMAKERAADYITTKDYDNDGYPKSQHLLFPHSRIDLGGAMVHADEQESGSILYQDFDYSTQLRRYYDPRGVTYNSYYYYFDDNDEPYWNLPSQYITYSVNYGNGLYRWSYDPWYWYNPRPYGYWGGYWGWNDPWGWNGYWGWNSWAWGGYWGWNCPSPYWGGYPAYGYGRYRPRPGRPVALGWANSNNLGGHGGGNRTTYFGPRTPAISGGTTPGRTPTRTPLAQGLKPKEQSASSRPATRPVSRPVSTSSSTNQVVHRETAPTSRPAAVGPSTNRPSSANAASTPSRNTVASYQQRARKEYESYVVRSHNDRPRYPNSTTTNGASTSRPTASTSGSTGRNRIINTGVPTRKPTTTNSGTPASTNRPNTGNRSSTSGYQRGNGYHSPPKYTQPQRTTRPSTSRPSSTKRPSSTNRPSGTGGSSTSRPSQSKKPAYQSKPQQSRPSYQKSTSRPNPSYRKSGSSSPSYQRSGGSNYRSGSSTRSSGGSRSSGSRSGSSGSRSSGGRR